MVFSRDIGSEEAEFAMIVRRSQGERRKRIAASRMKKRNTTHGTILKPRPYKVWKEHFIEDHRCERKQLWSEVFVSAIPHVLLNFLLVSYLFLGGYIFRWIDPSIIKSGTLRDNIFFSFTTIATIGYGAECPTSNIGKLAAIVYCVVGVPLIFMVLANNGQFIVDAYWILRNSYNRGTEDWDGEMPLSITFILLTLYMLIGGYLYSQWIGNTINYFDAVYFSFISVSTIGFGDIVVYPQDDLQTFISITYLSIGMIFLSTLTGSLSKYLQKLHYMGRQFSGVSDVEVWFGGQPMTVRQVITAVADHFDTSPELLHYVLNDLDHILEVALNKDTEDAVEHLRTQGIMARKHSMVQLELGPSLQRKVTVTRLNGMNGSPDRSLTSPIQTESSPTRSFYTEISPSQETSSPLFVRSVSRVSTPISRVPSNSSISAIVRRDSSKSLHALGVMYHAIQKRETVRRSLSFRRPRPHFQTVRNRSLLPAYPTVV